MSAEAFRHEWELGVQRTLAELGIPYDLKAQIIARVAIRYDQVVERQRVRQAIMDMGLDLHPIAQQLMEAFYPVAIELPEDLIKKLKTRKVKPDE